MPSGLDSIVIKGAREHNLKNVDLALPRNRLIVVTGLSGPANRRWRSTRFTPRDNAVTSSRCRRTRGSSWADGKARRRLHRGIVAGDFDRPEVDLAQSALDGRHGHRNLRLSAFAVRAHRHAALLQLRPRRSARNRANRSSIRFSSYPKARASLLAPLVRGRKGEYTKLFEEIAKRASRAFGSTARSANCAKKSISTRSANTRSKSSSTVS